MFGSIDTHAFVYGMGTNFRPFRLKNIEQNVEDAFLFNFAAESMSEPPFSVAVQWEKVSRIFSLFLLAATAVPVERYPWALKIINDSFNTVDCNCIAKVSVIEPGPKKDAFLELAFSWTTKFPDAPHLDLARLRALQWFVREQMVQFIAEATNIEAAFQEAYAGTYMH